MYQYKEIPNIKSVDINAFLQKAGVSDDFNLCWDWNGQLRQKNKPYGRFRVNSDVFSAHRLSYFIFFGKDAKEMHVLHSCDNPKCTNPNHLFLGTNADNIADKVKKNRQSKNYKGHIGKSTGVKIWDNPQCAASKDDFLEIKNYYELKAFSINELANKYNCSKKAVSKGLRELGVYVPKIATTLSVEQVIQIRKEYIPNDYAKGIIGNSYILARKFNIGRKTIADIYQRKTWANI